MRRNSPSVLVVVCLLALSACHTEPAAPAAPAPKPVTLAAKVKPPPAATGKKLEKAPAPVAAAPVLDMSNVEVRGERTPRGKVASSGVLGSLGTGGSVGAGGLGLRGTGAGGGGTGVGMGLGKGSMGSARGSAGSGSVGYGSLSGSLGGRQVAKISVRAAQVRGRADPYDTMGTEDYGATRVNEWTLVEKDALSTFAADVDTASYTLARAKLLRGELPPKDSVRVEEWLNYFRMRYPQPAPGAPLAVSMDAAPSPFSAGKHLLRVGVQGRTLDVSERRPAHLTFLVDVSGSMQGADRLPLAKRALRMLVDNLREEDTVAMVTYAGSVKLALPPTHMGEKARIHAAIEELTAGGSTAMSSGIELAYAQAMKTLDGKSTSRVIILSDGDANVGATGQEEILKLIAGKVKEGVTVTTVGFGMGNYKSALMEQFADKGNGNHFYVDSLLAARRVFVEQAGGTLEVIAQDVKLQVEFDPKQVNAWRLVGYENRDIADRDFRNDKVDAGEIGSGHTVTALYELDLKQGAGDGLATVRLRAKKPRGVKATEQAFRFDGAKLSASFEGAPRDFRFLTAVMAAAEVFRQSPWAAEWNYGEILRIARDAAGDSAERREFVGLLESARGVAAAVARR